MSRLTRTSLPNSKEMLNPRVVRNVKQNLTAERKKMAKYADRGTKIPAEYKGGEKVLVQLGRRNWIGATILKKSGEPRSYVTRTDNGSVLRRNTIHIAKTASTSISSKSTATTGEDQQDTSGKGNKPEPLQKLSQDGGKSTKSTGTLRFGKVIRKP